MQFLVMLEPVQFCTDEFAAQNMVTQRFGGRANEPILSSMANPEEFCRRGHVRICPSISLEWHVGVRSNWGRRPLQNTCSVPTEDQPASGHVSLQDLNEWNEGQAVIIAGCDPNGICHARRHIRLAKCIIAPSDNTTVGT